MSTMPTDGLLRRVNHPSNFRINVPRCPTSFGIVECCSISDVERTFHGRPVRLDVAAVRHRQPPLPAAPDRLPPRHSRPAHRTSAGQPPFPQEVEGTIMKKLINDPANVVAEALLGIEAAHPDLLVDHQHKIIYRGDSPRQGRVGLFSGGGSGHEPLHGGFVGLGMLDAACAGEVFTSPVPDQMLAATKLVNGGEGVLHIVKNYTGDVMNFEMAAELAAAETGAQVISVVTDDDVAVQDSTWTAGRRGVGVTVLVEKIAGAAAEQRRSLEQVADVAREV